MIDRKFAEDNGIGITNTNESARAVNKLPLDIVGQTSEPISIKCETDTGHVMIHLGVVLVIANLGISCLLGEPAKRRNNIVCLPRHQLILIASGDSVQSVKYASAKPKYSLIRAVTNVTLAPGD